MVTGAAAAAGSTPLPAAAVARRYAVLGLGNLIQGDEALGGHVVALLQEQPDLLAALPSPDTIDLIDGGTVGLGLVPYLVGLDGLVVVDVIDGGAAPGTVLDLDGASILAHQTVMGVHDLGAEELLGAMLFMDELPRRVRVVGIQPLAITLGTELSPPVAAAVPGLLDAINVHLATWQAEDEATLAG
jgi:hydrogenase maturation protease